MAEEECILVDEKNKSIHYDSESLFDKVEKVTTDTFNKENFINVYPIFERSKRYRIVGSKLLHAYYNENGRKFNNEKDKENFIRQISHTAKKVANKINQQTTIILSSESRMSYFIFETIKQNCCGFQLIEEPILTISTEMIDQIVLEEDSWFRLRFKEDFCEMYDKLCAYFDTMEKLNRGTYERCFISDERIKMAVDQTLYKSKNLYAEHWNMINFRNILIIDDSRHYNIYIKQILDTLKRCYIPNHVSVISLLAKHINDDE